MLHGQIVQVPLASIITEVGKLTKAQEMTIDVYFHPSQVNGFCHDSNRKRHICHISGHMSCALGSVHLLAKLLQKPMLLQRLTTWLSLRKATAILQYLSDFCSGKTSELNKDTMRFTIPVPFRYLSVMLKSAILSRIGIFFFCLDCRGST